ESIAPIPEGVSFEIAAALPTPGLTAAQMVERAALADGQRVLIHGAGGSVGSLAVQLAKATRAHVAATAQGADTEYVATLGADTVVDTQRQRFEDVVGELDAVLDLVGGELQRRSWKALRSGGVLVSSVGLDGSNEQAQAERRGVRAIAFFMQRSAHGLERLADLVAHDQLRVRIGKVLPFPQAREAQDLSQRGGAQGKILMRVA
ncbi:MAG: NADP-dependent oxidoreductase, partial [Terriglobales bacterium]